MNVRKMTGYEMKKFGEMLDEVNKRFLLEAERNWNEKPTEERKEVNIGYILDPLRLMFEKSTDLDI